MKSHHVSLLSGGGGFYPVLSSCACSHVNVKALAPNWRVLFQLQPRTTELLTPRWCEPSLLGGYQSVAKGEDAAFPLLFGDLHVSSSTACCQGGHPAPERRAERNWFVGVYQSLVVRLLH